MTQAWSIPPDLFRGETVAVICAGPGVDKEILKRVSKYKRIAVRRAFELVPDADMLVAIDGPAGSLDDAFWKDAEGFEGIKICGVECEVDAKYIGTYYDRVEIGPSHVISIRNNGLFGIRCAALGGAAKILLVGFNPELYEAIHAPWFGLVKGLEQVTAELRARGIEVERVEPDADETVIQRPKRWLKTT